MLKQWESRPLADLVEFHSGGTPSKAVPEYWGGPIPWVTVKDMKTMRFSGTARTLTELGATRVTMTPKGSVLILVRGMGLFKDLPVVLCDEAAAFNQDIKSLVPRDGVDGEFLAFALISRKNTILRHVDSAGHGTGRLDTELLKSTPLPFPPLAEQRKIAAILSTWDAAIEKLRALRIARGLQKRGLMQALLTGKRRVAKSQDRRWRMVRLGEIAEIDRDSLTCDTDPDMLFDYVSLANVEVGRIVGSLNRPRFSHAPSRARRILTRGDILVSTVRPELLGFALVDERHQHCIASTGFAVVSPGEDLHGEYLFHYMFSSDMSAQLHGLVIGSSYPAISSVDVRKLRIVLPPLVEQRKIAEVLHRWDEEIALVSRKIVQLTCQKLAVMRIILNSRRSQCSATGDRTSTNNTREQDNAQQSKLLDTATPRRQVGV